MKPSFSITYNPNNGQVCVSAQDIQPNALATLFGARKEDFDKLFAAQVPTTLRICDGGTTLEPLN